MRKLLCVIFAALLLCGCGTRETFETLADVFAPEEVAAQKVGVSLPGEAVLETLHSDGGQLYLCDGYTVAVQTLPGGDLSRTVKEISGYEKDKIHLVETKQDSLTRYHMVWSSAGEEGDQISRAVIVDDGSYHYTVTVMAAARDAGTLNDTVQEILNSVRLRTD